MSLEVTTAAGFAVSFALTYVLAPSIVRHCWRRGLVKAISSRDIHTVPTPHGGGILIVVVAIVVAVGTIHVSEMEHAGWLLRMVSFSALVAGVGWLDDRRSLGVSSRLFMHIFAVTVSVLWMPRLFLSCPEWIEKCVTVLAWSWFVNVFNFMNGADGLAETEAVFLGIALALLCEPLAPVCLVVAGASAGFLRVNWHPARVFMGDVGSTWLGYVLGGLLLLGAARNGWRMTWPLATLPLVFCADATWTLISRVVRGHKPWKSHREFWFHRALALGLRHDQLAWRVVALNLALFAFAWVGLALALPWASLAAGLTLMGGVALRIRALERQPLSPTA